MMRQTNGDPSTHDLVTHDLVTHDLVTGSEGDTASCSSSSPSSLSTQESAIYPPSYPEVPVLGQTDVPLEHYQEVNYDPYYDPYLEALHNCYHEPVMEDCAGYFYTYDGYGEFCE